MMGRIEATTPPEECVFMCLPISDEMIRIVDDLIAHPRIPYKCLEDIVTDALCHRLIWLAGELNSSPEVVKELQRRIDSDYGSVPLD